MAGLARIDPALPAQMTAVHGAGKVIPVQECSTLDFPGKPAQPFFSLQPRCTFPFHVFRFSSDLILVLQWWYYQVKYCLVHEVDGVFIILYFQR
jgi:hypothetical protein